MKTQPSFTMRFTPLGQAAALLALLTGACCGSGARVIPSCYTYVEVRVRPGGAPYHASVWPRRVESGYIEFSTTDGRTVRVPEASVDSMAQVSVPPGCGQIAAR